MPVVPWAHVDGMQPGRRVGGLDDQLAHRDRSVLGVRRHVEDLPAAGAVRHAVGERLDAQDRARRPAEVVGRRVERARRRVARQEDERDDGDHRHPHQAADDPEPRPDRPEGLLSAR